MLIPLTGTIELTGSGSYALNATAEFPDAGTASNSFHTPVALFTTGDAALSLILIVLVLIEAFSLIFRRYV